MAFRLQVSAAVATASPDCLAVQAVVRRAAMVAAAKQEVGAVQHWAPRLMRDRGKAQSRYFAIFRRPGHAQRLEQMTASPGLV